jgi:hypothetical protein
MKTISHIENEVNQIRLQIHEETKNLTPEQNKARLENICSAAARKYGFRRVSSARETISTQEGKI